MSAEGGVGPAAERPDFPGYGITQDREGLMEWGQVEAAMTAARNYWVCTTRADGRPHAAPVWGVWLDGELVFSTGARSVKGRNLARNPTVAVHLESGDDVVMLEGEAKEIRGPEREWYERFAGAYEAKYPGVRPEYPDGGDSPVYRVEARVVFAWREASYPNTATKWRFVSL